MSEIIGTDQVIQCVGRWSANDLAFVESVHYSAGHGARGASVELIGIIQRRDNVGGGWPSSDAPTFRITYSFTGVQQFHIHDFGGGPTQIMGFDILDISDRGWDGICYSVEDYEQGRIALLCREAAVKGISPVVH